MVEVLIDLIDCMYLTFRNRSLFVETRDKFLSAAMQNTLDFKALPRNILETENAMRELRVTDLSADPVHEEQLLALSQTLSCSICRSCGNHNTKFCRYSSNYSHIVTASIDNTLINPLLGIKTESETMFLLRQSIVSMLCAMLCSIDIYPGMILYRVTIRIPICLDLVQVEILIVTYHQRRILLITWVEGGLLSTATPMVTVGQSKVDFGGIVIADIVELV